MSMGKMMVSEARLVKRLGLRPHVIYGMSIRDSGNELKRVG